MKIPMQVVKTKPYIRCIDAQTLNRKLNLKELKKKYIYYLKIIDMIINTHLNN